jgi:hypothetical protein
MRDYRRWHDEYDIPGSPLAGRLAVVRTRLAGALSAAPPGPIGVISMCAGQGRDVLSVLPDHARRDDVAALLVELDEGNVEVARRSAPPNVEVRRDDAALSDVYAGHVPADVVLACGIFGNVSDADVERTVRHLSMLCAPGATVIWTRHRRELDLTVAIRRWFRESGWEELAFDALNNETKSSVGTFRLAAAPGTYERGFRFFTFLR